MFEQVEDFNIMVVGVPSERKPGMVDDSEANWLVGALTEEINEFIDARADQDFPGCIDAMIDLMYFAMGGLTRMGIRAEVSKEIFNAVHSANMDKVSGIKAERLAKHDLDAVKPEGWASPEERIIAILEKHYGK